MDAKYFDALTRSLTVLPSRRDVLRGLTRVGLGLGMARWSATADAKNKIKNKKRKKPRPNAFGCLNVGQPCRGKDAKCCSGVCQGKKPKKGKKDTSKCVAHDSGGCQAGQTFAGCGGTTEPCTTSAAVAGACITTTGNAGYCSATTNCFSCQRDADCVPFCGPQAACVTCDAGCSSTGGTACSGTNYASCTFPP